MNVLVLSLGCKTLENYFLYLVGIISHYRIMMDRSWINLSRISDDYERGVGEFIEFAQRHGDSAKNRGKMRCPRVNCLNGRILNVAEIREHLLCDGFLKNYTTWMWHGELVETQNVTKEHRFVESIMEDRLEDMICDVEVQTFAKTVYENMTTDAETSLYPGSTNFLQLLVVLRLINLKALNGWTGKSFTELL